MAIVMNITEDHFVEMMQTYFPQNFTMIGLKCLYEHIKEMSDGIGEDYIFTPANIATEFHEYGVKELIDEYPVLLDSMVVEDVIDELDEKEFNKLLEEYDYHSNAKGWEDGYDFLCRVAKPKHLYNLYIREDEDLFEDFFDYYIVPVLFDNGAIAAEGYIQEDRWIIPTDFNP